MDTDIFDVLVRMGFGAACSWVTWFWIKPILCYSDIRRKVISDLIYFANVINADGMNEDLQERLMQRVKSARRHSADLTACFESLPKLLRIVLKRNGHDLQKAARSLMGYSNERDYDMAHKRLEAIKKSLRITTAII